MTNIRTMRHVVLVALFFAAFCAYGQQKYALVIGNADYTAVTRLNNPVNDANDMATTLQGLGFQVEKVLDGNLDLMENAVIRMKNRLSTSPGAYGFFFYAGHGVQSGGENYLIPVDADIKAESFLRTKALQVQAVLDELNAAGNALNIVVLDACRDNPFSWGRSNARGLQVVGGQPADSIIVFATSAGKTAADGTGRNGLFTTHLLNNLKTPGLEVKDVFNRTGADVQKASNREQVPAVYNQFFGSVYLAGTTPQPAPTPQPTPPPIPSDMVRINGGSFMMGSPASEAGREDNEGPQHRVTVGSFYMSKYELTVGEFRQFVNATGYKTTAETSGGGLVWTGSAWETKVDANWQNPYFSQQDNQPVVLVSWFDAVRYCNWRSEQERLTPAYTINGDTVNWNRSANGYRLPTEAEWEYACRAGTTTRFSSGDNETTLAGKANVADMIAKEKYTNWTIVNIRDGYTETAPVGSFAANSWGLYDMHGNVWEWCWDWYGDYGSGSQTDPLGASSGTYRVYRGGGWHDSGQDLRSASRGGDTPSGRYGSIGFRLLRPSL